MNDRVGNWNKTRTNSFFGHRVGAYLESLGVRGYLFHSLIFPHSLYRIKDFGIQLTNSAVVAEICIFLKLVLFPTWMQWPSLSFFLKLQFLTETNFKKFLIYQNLH